MACSLLLFLSVHGWLSEAAPTVTLGFGNASGLCRGRCPCALYRPQLSSAGEKGLCPPAHGTGVRPAHAKCFLKSVSTRSTEQTRAPNPSAQMGKTATQQPVQTRATRQGQTPHRARAFREGMFEIPLDSLPASGLHVSCQLLTARKRTSGRRCIRLQDTWPRNGCPAEPRTLPLCPLSRSQCSQSQKRNNFCPPNTRSCSNRIKACMQN